MVSRSAGPQRQRRAAQSDERSKRSFLASIQRRLFTEEIKMHSGAFSGSVAVKEMEASRLFYESAILVDQLR
jgi:hypothetical protein